MAPRDDDRGVPQWLDDPLDDPSMPLGEGIAPSPDEGPAPDDGPGPAPPRRRRLILPSRTWDWVVAHKSYILKGFVGIAFFALLFGGAVWFWRYLTTSPHFRIRRIEVSVLHHDIGDEIRRVTSYAVGRNIFTVDLQELQSRVEKIPWVARARAWRSLPDTIHLEISEHESVAAVHLEGHGFFLVNREGAVFKKADPPELKGLPVITGITVDDLDHSDLPIRQALSFLATYQEDPSRPPLSEVRPMGTTLVFVLRDRPVEVHIALDGHLRERLASFDRILPMISRDSSKTVVVYVDIKDSPTRVVVRPVEAGSTKSR